MSTLSPSVHPECQDLLAEISRMSNTGGWFYDVVHNTLHWTEETYHIYGLEIDTPITPKKAIEFYTPASKAIIEQCFNNALQEGKNYEVDVEFNDASGNFKWVRTTGKVVRKNGKISHVYGAIEDITKERQLLLQERNTSQYLEKVINNLNDAVITVDETGVIISANKTTERIFKCKTDDLIDKNVTVLMPKAHAKLHAKYISNYLTTGNAKIIGVGRELPARKLTGEEFPMELSLTEINIQNKRIFIGIIRDISEKKAAISRIYNLAYYDSLTQLPNRRSFENDVTGILKKAKLTGLDIYCALLDIDCFSEINLIYGQSVGDSVIKKVSEKIQETVPMNFRLYRNMADSFFLLYQTPLSPLDESINRRIKRLEKKVSSLAWKDVEIDTHHQAMTLSIGSLRIPAAEVDNEKLIQLLEFSSNQAKSIGLNQCIMLDKQTRQQHERQTLIRYSMLPALEKGEFSIMLQPQYSVDLQPKASEALIRWNSEALGFISPDEFISLAEENGDILIIGDWVINEVCKLAADLQNDNIDVRIAINISAKQIVQPDFGTLLLERIQQWNVNPARIMLEITESTLVKNIDLVRKQMLELSEKGLSFSIDDFGTGYSSLRYLKELPINELKIDRYFVEEINDENVEIPIVNTIIEMAKALGVETVAEGIETQAQLTYLKRHGCNYFQGFYLNKPMPIEQWKTLLQSTKKTQKHSQSDK
ncbi:sensor domain-containing protein [Alteromonas sp. a30]|uniref:sensor domain-containing protein n=1 Tax=Alteromonas sp. a30 TaxID=2730917 RepID=UPI00227FC752|nr:GGDEF domain-containing phosphodiesterase [Alteromonas sp. a30]MCY7294699.1 EAL domain-containing protein [Alteromonas sp. a30]